MRIDPMMLLVGAGGAATGASQGIQRQDENELLRRRQLADQAMKQLEFKTTLAGQGFVTPDQAESGLQTAIDDPARAIAPSLAMSRAPSTAPLITPGVPNLTVSRGPGPGAPPTVTPDRMKAAMLQLVTSAPRPQTSAPAPRPANNGAPFRTAVAPRTSFTDPSTGESQPYVLDETRTPEARELRGIQARAKAEVDATAAQDASRRKAAQDAERQDIEHMADAILASGLTGPDGKQLDRPTARAMAWAHKYAPELVKDPNIDPLSPQGIKAAAARAGGEAKAKAPFEGDKNKPSDLQSRAALVYDRARDAASIIDDYGLRAPGMRSRAGEVPVIGNFLLPEDLQKLNNAGEILATAVLRLESGAAIARSEAQSYARQFLPQPGDSEDVLKQKAQIRGELVERIRSTAGPALRQQTGAAATSTTVPVGDTRQSAPLHAVGGKQQITADQADYLRHHGMSDAQIHARYVIAP